MFIEFLTSKFFFIIPMLVGGMAFWWLLRFMSMSQGIKWAEVRKELHNGNQAMATYFGLRAIAVAIAVGLFVLAGSSI